MDTATAPQSTTAADRPMGMISKGLRQHGPIGLEFAAEELHLVQLTRNRSGAIHMRANALVEYGQPRTELLTSPADMKNVIRIGLRADRFVGKSVVTVLPSGEARILPVTYEAGGSLDDDGEIILEAMANRVPGDLADYVVDYMPIRATGDQKDRVAMVVIARREKVVSYLDALRHCGLEVNALDIGPMAIRRLVMALAETDHTGNVLVINFGNRTSYLTMISGRRLLFDTEIEFGEEPLVRQVCTALEMSEQDVRILARRHGIVANLQDTDSDREIAHTLLEILKPVFLDLVEDIQKALVYAAAETRGEAVSHIYMLGSIARWPGTAALLSEFLNLEIESIPDPLLAFTHPKPRSTVVDTRPEMAVATGLALRGLLTHA